MSLITKHWIDWDSLEAALRDPVQISEAFTWAKTIQGYAFWEEFAHGKVAPEQVENTKALLRAELMLRGGGSFSVTEQQLEELL